MQTKQLIILAGAAAVAFLIVSRARASTTGPTEITRSDGTGFGTGWRYFSDGTVIDAAGNYWKGGQRVYTAPDTSTTWGREARG